jgi:hypothetical protein
LWDSFTNKVSRSIPKNVDSHTIRHRPNFVNLATIASITKLILVQRGHNDFVDIGFASAIGNVGKFKNSKPITI